MVPFKGPQPHVLILQLQRDKDPVCCATLGVDVSGHRQEQLSFDYAFVKQIKRGLGFPLSPSLRPHCLPTFYCRWIHFAVQV